MNRSIKLTFALLLLIAMVTLIGCQSTAVRSARVYLQQNNPEKAIEVLEEGTQSEPENPEVWFELGNIYGMQSQYEKMNDAYDKAVALDASYEPKVQESRNVYWDKHYRQGANLGNENKFEEAVKEFELAATIDPTKAESQFGLGWSYSKLGEHEKAIPYLEKAIELNPEDLNSWHQLISEYYITENDQMLIETCEELVTDNPEDVIGLEYLARAYEGQQNDSLAVVYYERVLELKPEDGDLWFNLGALYGSAQKYEDAARCFRKTLENIPDDYDALYNLALVLNRDKKFDEAMEVVDHMISLQPDDADGYRLKGDVYRNMAQQYEEQGNEEKANEYKAKTAEAFKKAQELSKDES